MPSAVRSCSFMAKQILEIYCCVSTKDEAESVLEKSSLNFPTKTPNRNSKFKIQTKIRFKGA